MGAISRHFTKAYLAENSQKHLQHYPQVACFSFDLISNVIAVDGRFESDELNFLSQNIFPQLANHQTCLDIGANIGNHSLFFADYFQQVIAFEPHPRTFKLLDCNADVADNITPLNIGASNAEGFQTAHDDPLNMGGASLEWDESSPPPPQGKSISFNLRRLDDIPEVRDARSIDFIKIDVERHEKACIEGAEKTLMRHHPVIAMEVLAPQISNGEAPALKLLEKYGYTHFYDLRSNDRLSWAPRPLAKLSIFLLGLLFNYRPPNLASMAPLKLRSDRDYPMILCSVFNLT